MRNSQENRPERPQHLGPWFIESATPRNGQCPVCGAEGKEFGAVAVGIDGRTPGSGYRYFPNVGWLPDSRLCICPQCHNLFVKRGEEAPDA